MNDEEVREVIGLLYNALVRLANQPHNDDALLNETLNKAREIMVKEKKEDE